MATMAEKMVASLEELRKLQEKDRCVVLQGTAEIGRTHLTRLLDNGWLQEVMKGWYIALGIILLVLWLLNGKNEDKLVGSSLLLWPLP